MANFGEHTIDNTLTSDMIKDAILNAEGLKKEDFENLYKDGKKEEYQKAIKEALEEDLIAKPKAQANLIAAFQGENFKKFIEIINKNVTTKAMDNLSILLKNNMEKIDNKLLAAKPKIFTALITRLKDAELKKLGAAIAQNDKAVEYILKNCLTKMLNEEDGFNYSQFEAISIADSKLIISNKITNLDSNQIDKIFKNISKDSSKTDNYIKFYRTLTKNTRVDVITKLLGKNSFKIVDTIFSKIQLEPNKKDINYIFANDIIDTIITTKREAITVDSFKNTGYVQNIVCLFNKFDNETKKDLIFGDSSTDKLNAFAKTIVKTEKKYCEALATTLSDEELGKVFAAMSLEEKKQFVGKLSITQKSRAMRLVTDENEKKELIEQSLSDEKDLAAAEKEQKEAITNNDAINKGLNNIQQRKERIKSNEEKIREFDEKAYQLEKKLEKVEARIEKFQKYSEGKRMIRPGAGFKRHIFRGLESNIDFWTNLNVSENDFISNIANNKLTKLIAERQHVADELNSLIQEKDSIEQELEKINDSIKMLSEQIKFDNEKIKTEKIAMRDARIARKKQIKDAKKMLELLKNSKNMKKDDKVGAITNNDLNQEVTDRAWAIITSDISKKSTKISISAIKTKIQTDSVIAKLNQEQLGNLAAAIQKELEKRRQISLTDEDFQEQLGRGMSMGISNAIMIVAVTAAVIMGLILILTLIIS